MTVIPLPRRREAAHTGPGRGGIAGLAGAAASAVAQVLVVLVITRAFDARTAGTFFTFTATCLMLAGVLRLDTANGLIYFVARSRHDHETPDVTGYFRAALVPVVLLSLGAAAIAVTRAPVLAAVLPVVVCADVLIGATRGFGSMRLTVLLGGLLRPVAQLVLVIAVAAGHPTGSATTLLAAAWAVPYLPVLIIGAVWLWRRVPRTPRLPGAAREFWRFTAPRSLASALQAVFQRLDVVIVAMLAGPVEAAVYTTATRFKVVGQLAGQGLAQATQPHLVRALADGDLERAGRLYRAATRWLIVLTWPIWLGYAALSPWLPRVFGEAYAGGAAVALVLSATMLIATACGMVDVVLVAGGHTTASLANIALSTALTVILDIFLVPAHGALGAAFGWAGGMVLKNLLPLVQILRRYELYRPPSRYFWEYFGKS
ncbi:MAG TPA: lipopolysaccharide biosynthesis protein [Thermopolyspora sp.]